MSPIIDDLRIEAEIPPKSVRPGSPVVVTLRFSNLGTRLRTLFLIRDETFRYGQSTFQLSVGSGPPVVQPPRRPGHVVTTADFHSLPPRGRLEFSQTLRMPRDIPLGEHAVRWVYENDLGHWPVSPNDSSSGQPIPGIWKGRIEDQFTVEVSRGLIGRRGTGIG